jgi:hypothetical protein
MLRLLFLSAMYGAMLNADTVIGDLGDGPVLHSAGWREVGQTFTVPATDNVLTTWEFNIAPKNSDGGLSLTIYDWTGDVIGAPRYSFDLPWTTASGVISLTGLNVPLTSCQTHMAVDNIFAYPFNALAFYSSDHYSGGQATFEDVLAALEAKARGFIGDELDFSATFKQSITSEAPEPSFALVLAILAVAAAGSAFRRPTQANRGSALFGAFVVAAGLAQAQLIDQTKAPNAAREGIAKSLEDQIGAGRGDWNTPNSSSFLINRDPFRAIRRGRQLFQRKFQRQDGSGPHLRDGSGDIGTTNTIGAGSADGCASCHGRPRGSAGFGGDVATRPDSRDAPHLFGLGLKEMLADEITTELRDRRAQAAGEARTSGRPVTIAMQSKGISYGSITVRPDGTANTTALEGIDADLRVKPFFHHGGRFASLLSAP